MNARALMARLARDGVALQADGGRLKVKAPAALDAQVLAEVQRQKSELLRLLAAPKTMPRTFDVGAAYEPAIAAAYARKLYRCGEITTEQRDHMIRYAHIYRKTRRLKQEKTHDK